MNNLETKNLLDSITAYTNKKNSQVEGSVAKIVGGTIKGITSSGRYQVKINPFDDEVLNLWPIGEQTFSEGDKVFILYWGDLTNGKILCKNR